MTIDLTTTTAATDAARTDVTACVVAAASPSAVVAWPAARERAVAPTAVITRGHVRLGFDAIDHAGTPAWSPPT